MKSELVYAIVIVVILIIIWRRRPKPVQAQDKKVYKVLTEYKDYNEAVDRLAMINQQNTKLIEYMNKKYGSQNSKGAILAQRLKDRYREDTLEENYSDDPSNTSYTLEKGDKIAYCLREKITGNEKLHDQHILEFVNLHEIAHVASEGYGHDEEFWDNFKFILNEANEAKLHTPRDYARFPINYCGMDVSYNPFYT